MKFKIKFGGEEGKIEKLVGKGEKLREEMEKRIGIEERKKWKRKRDFIEDFGNII